MPKPVRSFLLFKAPFANYATHRSTGENAVLPFYESPEPLDRVWWESTAEGIEEGLRKAGRTETSREWLDWVLEHCPHSWIRVVANRQGHRIFLDAYDQNEAFSYRMRWT